MHRIAEEKKCYEPQVYPDEIFSLIPHLFLSTFSGQYYLWIEIYRKHAEVLLTGLFGFYSLCSGSIRPNNLHQTGYKDRATRSDAGLSEHYLQLLSRKPGVPLLWESSRNSLPGHCRWSDRHVPPPVAWSWSRQLGSPERPLACLQRKKAESCLVVWHFFF